MQSPQGWRILYACIESLAEARGISRHGMCWSSGLAEKPPSEACRHSVFITDEKRTSSGSGVLFYPGSGSNLYIFTCAHVLDNLEEPFQIYSLLPLNREQELYRVEKLEAMREQVKYSPIDKVSESAGGVIEHAILSNCII